MSNLLSGKVDDEEGSEHASRPEARRIPFKYLNNFSSKV